MPGHTNETCLLFLRVSFFLFMPCLLRGIILKEGSGMHLVMAAPHQRLGQKANWKKI